jgi:tetratricopeptide (TPR) repeat protein
MATPLVLTVALACVGLAACAARRPVPPARSLGSIAAEVDGLVREGCYACLRSALDALPPPGSPLDARRFDVLVLLASRALQLDLDGEPDWLAEGRAQVPAPGPRQALLLDLAALSSAPGSGQSEPLTGQRRADLAGRTVDLLARRPQDPVAAYFVEQARCLGVLPRRDPDPCPAPPLAPLAAYRAATCGPLDGPVVDAFANAHPRFTEMPFFRAVVAFSAGALLTAERELDAFDGMFRAPASALLRGQVLVALEEFEPAVAVLDGVLSARPDRPDALLHRMRALGLMGDAAGGEAAANRLIALGTWHQGEAFYWRAWSRRALGRLAEAAADVETAKRVLFNAAVPKLAGFIAFERGQLAAALEELTASRDRRGEDCEVRFAIGQVHARERRWLEASETFSQTIDCAVQAQAAAGAQLEEIARASLAPVRRERMRLRVEHVRSSERAREGLATLNAGISSGLAGRPADARALLESATAWPELADRARDLLRTLPR